MASTISQRGGDSRDSFNNNNNNNNILFHFDFFLPLSKASSPPPSPPFSKVIRFIAVVNTHAWLFGGQFFQKEKFGNRKIRPRS